MLGGPLEDAQRLRQQVGEAPLDGFTIRSASSLLASHSDRGRSVGIFLPEIRAVHNSTVPFSLNEGSLWAGRGLNLEITGGVRVTVGALTFVLVPQITRSQNLEFQTLPYPLGQEPERSKYAAPWYYPPESIDRPQRFGDDPLTAFTLGQSSLSIDVGPVAVGAATENLWWGPARMNALVMSDNAPGIPHLFVRTGQPARTPLGSVEAMWMVGRLGVSGYFDEIDPGPRSISALTATLRPAFEPDLSIGFARAVYARSDEQVAWIGHAFDVLRDVGRPARDAAAEERVGTADQVFSVFGRWVFPRSGVDLYGEWGRTERPASIRDFLEAPNHTQGYTVGARWAHPVRDSLFLSLGGELTNLELSSTYRSRPTLSWYTSPAVTEGYTHKGRVIGAAIGPGASSQWIDADLVSPRWKVGVFVGRIRWDNGVFYTRAYRSTYLGHDVSVHTGVRGGIDVGPFMVEGEFASYGRYNYLFQHIPTSIDEIESVDIGNRTLRLTIGRAASFR